MHNTHDGESPMKTGKSVAIKAGKCAVVRLVVVDDHPMLLNGVAATLEREEEFTVCGTAASAEEALDIALSLKPDVVITDLSFPGKGGLELVKDLKTAAPEILTIAFSMHDEMIFAERALRAGAMGYVMKSEAPEQLLDALRAVLKGELYVSPAVSTQILSAFASGEATGGQSLIRNLSDREFDVFQLIGGGKSTSQIASLLHLSPKTIESHKAAIRRKLDIESSSDLMLFAMRWVEGQSE